jgi:hypothetical protein
MTKTAAAFTSASESAEAGQDLGRQIIRQLGEERPDAVIVFASAQFDHQVFLRSLAETCAPRVMVGASSAGEFTMDARGEGSACALAIRSPDMEFNAVVGRGVSSSRERAVDDVASHLRGSTDARFPHRAALVLTDALAGHADDLVEELTRATLGRYEFAGGGAGDDARFTRTQVFQGTEVFTDAFVLLEILSLKPVGIGANHGWEPASAAFRVTQSDGMRLVSLDGLPAAEVFEEHAAATGQKFDRNDPLPFFLHNILGIDTPNGYRLRVPLAVAADGSVHCAAEIATGAIVRVMKANADSTVGAATAATRSAVQAIHGARPAGALFFDCVATRLRMGDVFGFELQSVLAALNGAHLVGCNTYGQIVRAAGQFSGFHNCTAVVLVLPS